MESISKSISDYFLLLGQTHVLEDLYQFKFKEERLPMNINFRTHKCFDKNIELKKKLNQYWVEAEQPAKGDIIEYYIKDWGGIRGNSPTKMHQYRSQNSNEILSNGFNGISSWSKALVIHNPEKYYIYDSRVAFSINYLQIRYKLNDKYAFTMPESQSNTIKKGIKIIKNKYNFYNWHQVTKSDTYDKYLKLLEETSIKSGYSKTKIEMLLFSIAPNLANELINLS